MVSVKTKIFYKTIFNLALSAAFIFFISYPITAQDDELENILHQEVENINPVYKPVLSFGVGVLNYLGDVKNNYYSPTIGTLGYTVNLSTYLDNKRFFRGEFFFMGGKISGNERSIIDTLNFNFQTDIYSFGIKVNYDFDHFYKRKDRRIHPFISAGIGTLLFNSRTDSFASVYNEGLGTYTQTKYNYWSDGTIRDIPESLGDESLTHLMNRDFNYETPLRGDHDWGLGQYNQYGIMIPLDFGLDMQLSNRLMVRLGHSFIYTFTDAIDHVSYKNEKGRIGKKGNDMMNFTYVTFHLDLFSSAKTLKIDRFFSMMEFDPMLMGDEDNDGWPDAMDDCPGTPLGVATDSTGCPLDSDDDGIYDYLDKEQFSRKGAYVNSEGVEITEDDLIALLNQSMAVGRNEIDLYIRKADMYSGRKGTGVPIPEKFKSVDADKDNYISFDEMLKEIDRYFDFESKLTTSDIYELNGFFFAQ